MFCDEALDAIEAIAAGEVTPEGRVAQHLASCRNCASTLAAARRLETMLRARPLPRPSQQFTAKTMARLRRVRWRREQFLDAGFNVAVGLLALSVVGMIWLIVNRSGLALAGSGAFALVKGSAITLARRVAPSLPLYGGATALVLSALAIWWWAERDVTT